jgi:penicillin V acylase-like amidase (Ntn superfamily)
VKKQYLIIVFLACIAHGNTFACSILYYIDSLSGKIYAVNNEDFWYNVNPYLKIIPRDNNHLARIWYGWDNFAQGGVNESGLFFDGASTPEQKPVTGYTKPDNNLGDEILSKCNTASEALDLLEIKKVALTNGHLLFGDRTGNAVVVEWVNGEKKVIPLSDNRLMITNFLLSDTTCGNYPCPRYSAMDKEIIRLRQLNEPLGLKEVGNIVARAVQPVSKNSEGKESGTLYSTFIDLTDMKFILVYKLDNSRITKLDLKTEFANHKPRKIFMKPL